MKSTINIGLTIGDINGIGPEIIVKALANHKFADNVEFTIYGPEKNIVGMIKTLGLSLERPYKIVDPNIDGVDTHPHYGVATYESGMISYNSLLLGVQDANNNLIDAVVTAPLSKKALYLADFKFSGHTEVLQESHKKHRAQMVFVSDTLKLFTLTRHIPLKDVPKVLSKEFIEDNVADLVNNFKQDFGIKSPKIAICALNPHAGEDGTIGTEEREIIIPAIESLKEKGINVYGPFPADSFWSESREYDCVVALYHDQGLIPVKLLGMHGSVNVTLGLPIIRTSPCHGTAYDIAHKFVAKEFSFVNAINLAIQIAKNRNKLTQDF